MNADGRGLLDAFRRDPADDAVRRILYDWLAEHGEVTFAVGLDLGQRQDPSALVVLERSGFPGLDFALYRCAGLQRWPLQTPYRDVIASTAAVLLRPGMRDAPLVVDETGVGAPIVEQFRAELDHPLVPVTITGGSQSSRQPGGGYSVPKKDLVGCLQSMLGRRVLAFPRGHPLVKVLVAELRNFKVKVTQAANEVFSAWREGDNDDMVLALAVAAWYADRAAAPIDNRAAASSGRSLLADAPAGVFPDHPGGGRPDGGYRI